MPNWLGTAGDSARHGDCRRRGHRSVSSGKSSGRQPPFLNRGSPMHDDGRDERFPQPGDEVFSAPPARRREPPAPDPRLIAWLNFLAGLLALGVALLQLLKR